MKIYFKAYFIDNKQLKPCFIGDLIIVDLLDHDQNRVKAGSNEFKLHNKGCRVSLGLTGTEKTHLF